MSDKEKIRAEIERRYNERDRIGDNIRANVHKSLISFIDSMQEEPVGVWHDKGEEPEEDRQVLTNLSGYCYVVFYHKENKRFYMFNNSKHYLCEVDKWAYIDDILKLSNAERTEKNRKEEPVSEELEEEIIRYVGYPQEVDEDISTTMIRKAARHFANWQKEQIIVNTADATIGLPYENKNGGYTHLIDVSRPLPVGNNKIAIIFKED